VKFDILVLFRKFVEKIQDSL